MILSIITPHYNDFEGLQQIYSCLLKQSSDTWEWIIVDDFSDIDILSTIEEWVSSADQRVQFVKSKHKTNASVCRNIGLELASGNHVIFLDSDDYVGREFVANREVAFKDFAIFPNYKVIGNKESVSKKLQKDRKDLLNSYLSAQFLWQTSCVVWNKQFLIEIGKFDSMLHRLQDVELFIRAMFKSDDYKLIDNEIDFFYCAKPIRSKTDIVKKSCASVNYLISKLKTDYILDNHQKSLVKAYYYACAKSLQRCKDRKSTVYVKESLQLFRKKRYIGFIRFFIGNTILFCYRNQLVSDDLFLKINRYCFK